MDNMYSTTYFVAACRWHATGSHITKHCISGWSCYARGETIVQELPIINFIWLCQTIFLIIGETLVAYCIVEVEQWDQLFYGRVVRCQTDLHNLLIGVIDEERLCPLIISTYIILKGETSCHQVGIVLSTIVG